MNRKLKTRELHRLSVQQFKGTEKLPVCVILDNVRSASNVGSIFRTMDAFLMSKLYLCGITPQPPHREINKTALGASDTVEWEYFETTSAAVANAQQHGYEVWAVEQTTRSVSLNVMQNIQSGLCLVFGNEVNGISQAVIDMCSGAFEIPQSGTKHSLNIAVCAGIALWEAAKFRR